MSLIEIDDSLELKDIDLHIAKPNLNRNIIGHLNEAYNKRYTPKMGNISELSFTIPYLVERKHKLVENPNIDKIKDRYFIKAEYDNKVEWFRIDKLTESSDDNGEFLNVHAYSLGIELGDKTVRLVDETSKDVEYMMRMCLDGTLWDVGHIDTHVSTDEHNQYIRRSFDITETTRLDFLYQIAETFKGVIVWDTINRTVSLRTHDNVGSNKGLRISYGKYMKSLEKESNSNEMATRLIPHGRDNLSIRSVSPTGLDYIDDFTAMIYPFERDENRKVLNHSHYLEDDTCHAMLDYQELLNQNEGKFGSLLDERNTLNNNLGNLENEMQLLNTAMNQVLDSIDIEKANGRDYSQLESERLEIQSQINAKQTEINGVKSQLATNQTKMTNLQSLLSMESNFTQEQIMEINLHTVEKHWTDDNIINPEDLLKEAKKAFDELRKPATVFTIDIVNFTQILEGQKDWGKLNIGDTITIHHERLKENITAKIIEFDINFENQSVNLTIANTMDILSAEDKFYQRLAEMNMTSATLSSSKYRWNSDSDKVSEIEQVIYNTWDAVKREIVAGVNESVKISNRGIEITDSQDPNRMLIIQNGVLALSRDGGNTWRTAITPDYVVAENIAGLLGTFTKIRADQIVVEADGTEKEFGDKLFDVEKEVSKYTDGKDEQLRKDLRLDNPLPSTMRLNSTGIHVNDQYGNNRARFGQYATGKYGLAVFDKTGRVTILDEDGIMQTWQEGRTDNVDGSNPLVLNVYIPPETRLIRQALLRFRLLPFRAYSRGTASGGGVYTSTGSGGGEYTSTDNGGGDYTSTENGGSGYASSEALNWQWGDNGHDHGIANGTLLALSGGGSVMWAKSGQHTHTVYIPSHSHNVRIPSHSHSLYLPSHSHSISIGNHSHDIEYGIYNSTSATSVSVIINGINRTYNLGGHFNYDQNNLNITQYLNIGQWNTIQLGSSRLGRIDATVFLQAFIGM